MDKVLTLTNIKQDKASNGKPYRWLSFNDKSRYSYWKADNLVVGNTYKLVLEQNQKGYWNISSIEPVTTPQPNNVDNNVWAEKDQRIVRQAMIKAAVDYLKDKKEAKVNDVLTLAKVFENYVYRGMEDTKAVEKPTNTITENEARKLLGE